MNPPITVVTVTFNDLHGLERTVASLASQTLRNAQHVVIDGGSTDGTVAWLAAHRAFADTFVVSEPDRGTYDGMNKGLTRAMGDVVTFLNSGDAYCHDDVLTAVADSQTRDRWEWGFGAARVVDAQGVATRRVIRPSYHRLRHAYGRNTVVHQTVFARTDVVREFGGFDLRFPIAADFHLLLALGRRSRPALWNRVDVDFLNGGLSDRSPWRALWDMHRARCDVMAAGRAGAALDALWTGVLLGYVLSRREGKKLATRATGGRALRWWTGSRPTQRPGRPGSLG